MIITRAPLRVSFFGGGSDYPEVFRHQRGAVLATAIDRHCYLTATRFPSRLFDYSIRLSYRQVELVERREDIQHRLFRACLEQCGIEADIELNAHADLPAFSGLGSSSSFTVALLNVLHAHLGVRKSRLELAYEAIYVERKVLDASVGCQDQVSAAMGGFNRIEFRAEDDILVEPLDLPSSRLEELQSHLVMIFTQITRSASPIEQLKLDRVEVNRKALRRMVAMVDEGADILLGGRSIEAFGSLLHEAWELKQSLTDAVSNPAIADLYRQGRSAGAWGGKLLGAGGGGFLLFVVPPERIPSFCEAFSNRELIRPGIGVEGTSVLFSS